MLDLTDIYQKLEIMEELRKYDNKLVIYENPEKQKIKKTRKERRKAAV